MELGGVGIKSEDGNITAGPGKCAKPAWAKKSHEVQAGEGAIQHTWGK